MSPQGVQQPILVRRIHVHARDFLGHMAVPAHRVTLERRLQDRANLTGNPVSESLLPARIRQELGWRPSVTVEEGLRRTVRWYLDNEGWWRPLLNRNGVGERLGKA